MDEVEKIVQETPPVDNAASRFGNPAFKTFYDKVEEVSAVYDPKARKNLLIDSS